MQYLNNATIDYKEDLMTAGFSISNPNAETSCGCGSSFSVADNFYDEMGTM
jgi:iron-sulfur cluster assembly accessory protein